MPTKSDRVRTQQERARQNEKPKKKATTRAKRKTADTAKPGVSAATGTGNRKRRAPKATAALESSATARPSRKSTRKSANRQKPDSPLELRATLRTVQSRRQPRPR